MNQVGYVTKVDGEKAHIIFKRTSSCGDKCANCSGGCEIPPLVLDIENTLLAEPGDAVAVNMEDNVFFKLTFFAYALPLILMLLGVAIAYITTKSETIAAFTGLGFLAISYGILRIVNNNHVKNQSKSVTMMKILSEEEITRLGM
ncbi:SoxR reducing system RseC family protein [Clostridium tetani]|uniref:Fis family transcriptional regulator n=1 Tax=Clostridium tetani TaxID=1513 RepID=A0ABY0EN99_CLOTA|nr:SoxR reducing system RseC family protein [Clostridium tetani]CDI49898.1 sigma-E factor regulator, RseC/MucC family [Clostridium tetani 12124569]KHO38726.1 hypothetical protein OR62_09250 [Clostridium tetani]RXI39530.1 Fis family transcriptional regulator [Clostridium tetani]RXI53854.1 Fis family transcriptional regulator [Clostridium tetani]RXI73465.1 Fis family transcriptional regulator [Clostridium tetani]